MAKYSDDKELILELVRDNGNNLKYASDRLKDDKEVVLEAVKNSAYALKYASERLKDDRDFVLDVVRIDGDLLMTFKLEYRIDRKLILEAVKTDWLILDCYEDDEMFSDKKYMCKMIVNQPFTFEWASEELRNDKEFVLFAIKNAYFCDIKYHIGDKLKDDKEIKNELKKKEVKNNKLDYNLPF